MNNMAWLLPIGLIILWFFAHRKKLATEALDVLELDSGCNDRGWTSLHELIMDVARHDVLARWHRGGRELLLASSEYQERIDGNWDVTVDKFGREIGDRYDQLFQVMCALPKKKRNAVLRAAKEKSSEARQKFRNIKIQHPDGTDHQFPSWMTES